MSRKKNNAAEKSEVPKFAQDFKVPVIKTGEGKVSSAFITMDSFTSIEAAVGMSGANSEVRKSSAQQDIAVPNTTYIPPPINPVTAYKIFTQDAFHARACYFIAHCIAGVGYDIIPYDEAKTDFQNDAEYKKLKDFCANPNADGDKMPRLTVAAELEQQIYGYSYYEVVSNKGGELAEIYNLRAINTYAKLFYNNLFYIQRVRGIDTWFRKINSDAGIYTNANEVLELQQYNPRTKYYGLAPWYSATPDLAISSKIIEYRLKKFDNNLLIQFMIICEGGELDTGAINDIKKFLSSNFKGTANAGKVLYLNSNHPDVKIRIERIDSDMPESGFIQTRDQSRDYISVAHGIAPILMGAIVKGQLGATTAIKDLFKIFNETIAKPRKEYHEDRLNYLFRTKLGINNYKFQFRELTIETLKDLVMYAQALVPAGIITADEARADLGKKEPLGQTDPLEQIDGISKQLREIKKKLSA